MEGRGASVRGEEDQPTEAKTCPWFYDSQPFVASIRSLLVDYEAGRLGPVWSLPAPLVDYLQVASDEKAEWEKYQQDSLS